LVFSEGIQHSADPFTNQHRFSDPEPLRDGTQGLSLRVLKADRQALAVVFGKTQLPSIHARKSRFGTADG
jgi:hypothetical protein